LGVKSPERNLGQKIHEEGVGADHTNVLGILAASLHLGVVVGIREWLLLSSLLRLGTVGGIEELPKSVLAVIHDTQGSGKAHLGPVMRCLEHHRTIAKLLHKAVLSLDG
jgi:hypothetical protein